MGTDPQLVRMNLHLLLWKQIIYALTCVDTEDATFEPQAVWSWAWKRFEKRATALQERVRTAVLRTEGRGNMPKDVSDRGWPLEPLGHIDAEGNLRWDENIVSTIKLLGKKEVARRK